MNLFRPISISLSPNTERDDIWLALKLIFQPWRWRREETIEVLENEFKDYLGAKHAVSFNSGRSSLMAILGSLNLNRDDEVLLQAFTCNAAANPIIWSNLKPIYVDCDENTFNIDLDDLKRKIGPKSKIVIVQHTFGLPAELDEVLEICKNNGLTGSPQDDLILIEDCAHALGATYKGQKIGTFGLASFFSFSRDKVMSSVYGGMVITNDPSLAEKLRQAQDKFGYPSYFWVFQQLLHPILMNYLVLPTYSILGKYLLVLFQGFKILSKAVHWKEKRGEKPSYFPKKLPNALATLALNQFKKLERFNRHREEIANFYFRAFARKQGSKERSEEGSYYENLKNTQFQLPPQFQEKKQIFLRFTIKHQKAHQIIKKAWQKNILIGDWYDKVIAPHDTRLDKMKYLPGSCPKAERLSGITFNLPTHINITRKEAEKILDFLQNDGN